MLLVIGVVGGAASAAVPWWRQDFVDPLSGPLTVTLTGGARVPLLVPMALVSGAGVAVTVVVTGLLRRVVLAIIALAGLSTLVATITALDVPPAARFAAALTRPAAAVGAPQSSWWAPTVAILTSLMLVVGAIIAWGAPERRRRLGVAYDSPAARRERTLERARSAAAASGADAHGEWWRAIDAGLDPTDGARPLEVDDDGPGPGAAGPTDTMDGRDRVEPPHDGAATDRGRVTADTPHPDQGKETRR